MVAVGGGAVGLRVAVTVGGAGVAVIVAGGVTCKISLCSGRIIDVLFSPFQAISSATVILYRLAIHESVSPLCTTW